MSLNSSINHDELEANYKAEIVVLQKSLTVSHEEKQELLEDVHLLLQEYDEIHDKLEIKTHEFAALEKTLKAKIVQLEEVNSKLQDYKQREIQWKSEVELLCTERDGSNERGRNLPPGDDTQESLCGWAQEDYAMINDCLKKEIQRKKREWKAEREKLEAQIRYFRDKNEVLQDVTNLAFSSQRNSLARCKKIEDIMKTCPSCSQFLALLPDVSPSKVKNSNRHVKFDVPQERLNRSNSSFIMDPFVGLASTPAPPIDRPAMGAVGMFSNAISCIEGMAFGMRRNKSDVFKAQRPNQRHLKSSASSSKLDSLQRTWHGGIKFFKVPVTNVVPPHAIPKVSSSTLFKRRNSVNKTTYSADGLQKTWHGGDRGRSSVDLEKSLFEGCLTENDGNYSSSFANEDWSKIKTAQRFGATKSNPFLQKAFNADMTPFSFSTVGTTQSTLSQTVKASTNEEENFRIRSMKFTRVVQPPKEEIIGDEKMKFYNVDVPNLSLDVYTSNQRFKSQETKWTPQDRMISATLISNSGKASPAIDSLDENCTGVSPFTNEASSKPRNSLKLRNLLGRRRDIANT